MLLMACADHYGATFPAPQAPPPPPRTASLAILVLSFGAYPSAPTASTQNPFLSRYAIRIALFNV